MARFRSGNAIQSKIQMILFGNPFTGKSTMALQSAYLKNPDGSPFKVLYLDPESGSVDDYLPTLAENGVDMRNILIAYTQSITEVLEFIERAKNGEDFYIPDDDGNETDEVYLDSDGKPFRPDMIVVDGASVLNLTTKTSIVEFSKKRAKVKAAAAGLTGDEKFVKIEGAGMELKDYQTVNFKGQELILDLMGSGKHYIVTARETDEKITKEINGKEVTVATGRKIPDGFKNMDYNAKTCIRMYRDEDDYTTVRAFVVKDRTGMYSSLHNHSEFSVLDGYGHPQEYLERAKSVGLNAFAITEHGNAYSWIYFDELKKNYPEIKMIYGVELYECFDMSVKDSNSKYFHLVALAKNERGRVALNEIVTQSNFEGFYFKPRIDLAHLRPYADDLIILSACLASKLARESDYGQCVKYINEYKSTFPNFFLEMQSHNTDEQRRYNQKVLELAEATNTEFVITTDSHAATKDDLYYQARHVQIAHDDETLTELYDGCYIQSEAEIYEVMSSQIGEENVKLGLASTNKVADMIENVDMPFQAPQLPTYPLPDGFEDNLGEKYAERYIDQLENHEIYKHDETNPLLPYCVSITMYPFLFDGLRNLGGGSGAPHNLDSFAGSFINLCFAIASQFAGAVSTPEFLSYMDYFVRKEYGDDYYLHADTVVDLSSRRRTIDKVICDKFEQIVYSLNQPAAARSFQSIFWNIAYFDKPYFNGLFENFVFPDGSTMKWDSVSWLQKRFMKWFNKERCKQILTFPVETLNLLDNGENYVDTEWADFAAEMLSEGHSFFNYHSSSVDSLASCCRLRNELQDNTFSFTLGAGGVSTGSKCVITINMNRLIQNAVRNDKDIKVALSGQVDDVHKYLLAYDALLQDSFNAKLLPVYDAGYISLEKQFLTIGINGLVEGAEYLGYSISPDDNEYCNFVNELLSVIYQKNKAARTSDVMFNTEYVPAENLGVKNSKWDKEDGYFSPRECYNSYFYLVDDVDTTPIDKFILHGKTMTGNLDGGAALHLNLDEHLSKEQYKHLMKVAIKTGCSYWTVNVPNTICNDCGHISKHHLDHCEKCGSKNIDYATRVIGYLKRVSNFSEARQKEAKKRYYAKA